MIAPGGAHFFFPKGKRLRPPVLFSREKRTGRLAVQERTRQGANRGISAEMQCGTAPRAARDLTGEPCSPVNPFFLDGRFGLGEGASHALGGVSGRISASCRQKCFWAPAIFLWYRQAAPSLSKKEMVGPEAPLLEGVRSAPSGRKIEFGRARRGILCALSAGLHTIANAFQTHFRYIICSHSPMHHKTNIK